MIEITCALEDKEITSAETNEEYAIRMSRPLLDKPLSLKAD